MALHPAVQYQVFKRDIRAGARVRVFVTHFPTLADAVDYIKSLDPLSLVMPETDAEYIIRKSGQRIPHRELHNL